MNRILACFTALLPCIALAQAPSNSAASPQAPVTSTSTPEVAQFQKIEDAFHVSDFGGWDRVKVDVIDGVWKNRVLKGLRR